MPFDETGKIETGLYADLNYVEEQEKERYLREKFNSIPELRENIHKEYELERKKQEEEWRIQEAEVLKHNQNYSNYLQERFNELREQIFNTTETEYNKTESTVDFYDIPEITDEMKTEAFFELAKGFCYNKKTNKLGITEIERNLKVLAADKELITKLLKVMFYNLYQTRYSLNRAGYGLGTSLLERGSIEEGLKLENYLITIAIIQEKGYQYNLDALMEIETFMPENPNLRVPLDIAVAYMTETITKNTNSNKKIPNPINIVSNTLGEEEIDITHLSNLVIKAMNTGHKLSDDSKNFPKFETKTK